MVGALVKYYRYVNKPRDALDRAAEKTHPKIYRQKGRVIQYYINAWDLGDCTDPSIKPGWNKSIEFKPTKLTHYNSHLEVITKEEAFLALL